MKAIAIAALILVLWSGSESLAFRALIGLLVCCGAAFAVVQSYKEDKFRWGIAFIFIAIVFNPINPMRVPHLYYLLLGATSVAVFGLSFRVFEAKQPVPGHF
jgi:uncharacterized protein DUF6804